MKTYTFKDTLHGCYLAYITQAIVNNLAPLLFVIFQRQFEISLASLSLLIVFNFGPQLITDCLAVKFVDRIGYRTSMVLAHALAFLGLLMLGVLPHVLPNAFLGLLIAAVIYGVGGGLIEVLVSPIVDSLPGEAKDSAMALLHSFYCWGQVSVVAISTLLIWVIGENWWFILPVVWSLLPLSNLWRCVKMPLMPPIPEERKMSLKELVRNRQFILILVLMLCAGASELTMSQWSSLFAEEGLGVPKVLGDLLGPCLFAILMGAGRTIFGVYGAHINTKHAILATSALCVLCYLTASLSTIPLLSLFACALTGLGISLMWPGIFALAARALPRGGTALFGMMALFGDLGCLSGPWLAGNVSNLIQKTNAFQDLSLFAGLSDSQIGLKCGLLLGLIFPLVMLLGVRKLRTSTEEVSNI